MGTYAPGCENFRKYFWVLSLFTLFVVAVPTLAQLPTGTILGVVKDASGAVVPGTTVTIRSTDTGLVRTATTGDDGAYRIPALPVGHYDVKAEHSGFKTETQTGLTLEVEQEAVVNFTLQVGTTQQQVIVTGEAPLVDTTNSSLGGIVNENKMADLPLNGRNYIDLSLMQPGVAEDMNMSGSSGLGGTGGTWFSSNGAPVRSNNFTLDGAMLVNQVGGTTSSAAGTTLGVDGIKEYKVITNAFSAEYGMAMGSQMVMVSKGGTNQYHGDVFEYLRNSDLDARNFFDYGYQNGEGRLPHFERNNFGGSFGGPIRKDKTFFYGVYEGLREQLGNTEIDTVFPAACHTANNIVGPACVGGTANVAVAPVMQPLLALYPIPNVGTNGYTYPTSSPTSVNYAQMRVDQNFSASDAIFGRYTVNESYLTTPASSAGTGSGYQQFRSEAQSFDQFITVSENHIFSPTLLNTVRLSFSRTNDYSTGVYTGGVSSLTGPQYSFDPGLPIGNIILQGITELGPSLPSLEVQNIYTLSDDLFYTKGRHALKFGFLGNRFNQGMNSSLTTQGQINFTSITNFMKGIPSLYTSVTPGSNLDRYYIYNTFGFYAQDDFRLKPTFTLNLGLRYEFSSVPIEQYGRQYALRNLLTDEFTTPGPVMVNDSLHDFSPRVGFAWDVTGKGKTSLRGAFGMFYDLGNLGSALNQDSQGTPPLSSKSQHNNTSNAVLSLPLTFLPSEAGNTLHTMIYHDRQPYVLQYNLTAEQQLPFGIGLLTSYVGSHGVHLWISTEGNPEIPTSDVNGVEFYGTSSNPRYNPYWSSNELITTAGFSWYNSLQVVANKRLSHGLEFQSAYTWSKSLDASQGQELSSECRAPGAGNGVDPLHPRTDYGPSCFDLTNNWRFNLIYHFPNIRSNNFAAKLLHGWWMGNIVSLQSGYPFSAIVGTIRSRSGAESGLGSETDRASVGTATVTQTIGNNSYTFVPYNPKTVIEGTPNQWFNPLMFELQPVGYLGTAARDAMRGPGLTEWDFSLVKDTAMPFLGEAGNLEFRAEFFNIMNIPNFGEPNGTVFPGTLTDTGTYSEAPESTAGQITTTVNTSRQIQLALKLIF